MLPPLFACAWRGVPRVVLVQLHILTRTLFQFLGITLSLEDVQAAVREEVKELREMAERSNKLVGEVLLVSQLHGGKSVSRDIWTMSKRTKSEQASFKDDLVRFYDRADPSTRENLFCMVLDRSYPRNQVRAAHIWKRCTNGIGLDAFGLSSENLEDPRNGLLLAEAIEEAFDVKRVCFVAESPLSHASKLLLKVLDPALMDAHVTPSTTRKFGDINGAPLSLTNGNTPYRRILSFHAQCSFAHARASGWISREYHDAMDPYWTLSESGGALNAWERESELQSLINSQWSN